LLWRFVPFLTDVGRYEKELTVDEEIKQKVIRENKGEIICYNIPNNERKYRRIKREEKRTERLHPIDYYDLLHQDCTHRMILLSCARRMW